MTSDQAGRNEPLILGCHGIRYQIKDVRRAVDFYTTHLGFRTVTECGIYVQLAHPTGAQIAVLRHEVDGPVRELVSATDGRGVWLNLDVVDADAEHRRLTQAGVEIASPLEDTSWGDRQFIVRDPNGVLISIAHRCEIRGTETRPLAAN